MNSQNCRFVHVQSPPTQNCPFLFNIPRVIAMQAIYKKTWEILTFWAKNYGLLDKNTHVNLTYRSYLAYCRATDFDICSLIEPRFVRFKHQLGNLEKFGSIGFLIYPHENTFTLDINTNDQIWSLITQTP